MKVLNCQQGTAEWSVARLGKFGGTDAQAVMTAGKGLETLAFEKVVEIMTGKSKESYTNPDMDRGHELEMSARNMYEIETGNTVTEVGYCQLDDYSGCSPDGFIGDDGLVEIKCPRNDVFVRYLYDKKVDPKYYAQMQMQMYVTGRKWVDYVVFNPNFKKSIIVKRIEIDEESQVKLCSGLAQGITKIKEINSGIKN